MTDDRSLERAARSWLEEGPIEAPDRPVQAALARVQTTSQERDLRIPWIAWRPRTMFDRLAVAAMAAVVAIGTFALGAALLLKPPGPAAGACPKEFSEAQAIDTFAPGLSQSERSWGIDGGAPARVRPGLIAAFAWDAPVAPQHVITIDPATGARCRLVSFVENKPIRANVTGLDWSPSGDALAIGLENPQDSDGNSDGQLLIWTSGRLLRVWSGPGQNPHFEWAPDGRSIATWIPYGDPTPNTRIVFADGSPDRIIEVQPIGLRWSPDGSRWIVAEATEVFGAGTLLSVVEQADGRVTPIDLGIAHLSPEGWIDNERVLLYGVRQDQSVVGYLDVPLAVRDSYSVIELPEDALRPDKFVVFSPDRRRVAYATAGGDMEIADLAGEPGGTPVHVDAGGAGILGLAWAPDGSKLVFTTFPVGSTATNTTWVVNADGTDLRQIAGDEWTQDDPWQPVPVR